MLHISNMLPRKKRSYQDLTNLEYSTKQDIFDEFLNNNLSILDMQSNESYLQIIYETLIQFNIIDNTKIIKNSDYLLYLYSIFIKDNNFIDSFIEEILYKIKKIKKE